MVNRSVICKISAKLYRPTGLLFLFGSHLFKHEPIPNKPPGIYCKKLMKLKPIHFVKYVLKRTQLCITLTLCGMRFLNFNFLIFFSKQAIQDVEATGRICILDVDMQGVKNIKATNINPKYIFCQAPSMEILVSTLSHRGLNKMAAILQTTNGGMALSTLSY